MIGPDVGSDVIDLSITVEPRTTHSDEMRPRINGALKKLQRGGTIEILIRLLQT